MFVGLGYLGTVPRGCGWRCDFVLHRHRRYPGRRGLDNTRVLLCMEIEQHAGSRYDLRGILHGMYVMKEEAGPNGLDPAKL